MKFSKWKGVLVLVVFVLVGEIHGQYQNQRQHQNQNQQNVGKNNGGRRLRVPGYEIKFGAWPIMEVTKLSRQNRQHQNNNKNKRPSIGGFMRNAIHNQGKHPVGVKGPHLPGRGQGPTIFADIKSPLPPVPMQQHQGQRLPVPMGAPAPMGVNNLLGGHILFQGQPFPVPGAQVPVFAIPITPQPPTTTTTTQKPIEFHSIMQNAAYSGYFGRGQAHPPPQPIPIPMQHFQQQQQPRPIPIPVFQQPQASRLIPNFRPFQQHNHNHNQPRFMQQQPRPFFVPLMTMMGDVATAASERFESVMRKVPQIPPVIRIGEHPPEGYKLSHGEQQLVTLKLPDVKFGKKADSKSLLRGAEWKFHSGFRRNDNLNLKQATTSSNKFPDVGAIYTVNMVLQTPNISAPVNGSESPHFQEGMEQMARIYGNSVKESPLSSQVKLLGKLFTGLQHIKPKKSFIERESVNKFTDPFAEQEDRETPKVDAPLMAVHIQSYTVPEVGTQDPDVMESAKMFGLQGHRIEFGGTNEVINLMDTAQKATVKVPLTELGYTRGEVNQNLHEWVRSYVTLTRKMKEEAHSKGEGIATGHFRQHQVHARMPDNSMRPMDPKMFSQGATITNAGAIATYQG